MGEIKLTKNELRAQQKKLSQLEKYLPTLQLKKAMLQAEVYEARLEIERCEEQMLKTQAHVGKYASLLSGRFPVPPADLAKILEVKKHHENIAGVDLPFFEEIIFQEVKYSLFDTPPWFEGVMMGLRALAEAHARVLVAREKKEALEKELRLVSIRVNLFEKILIPRSLKNIKTIKVFLGDQELAAVSRAKVAKAKIEQHKAVGHAS